MSWRRSWLTSALVWIVIGCGEREEVHAASGHRVETDEEHAPHPVDPPLATLRSFEGRVTIDGAVARQGAELEREAAIEVADGGRAVVQLAEGGRVTLDGGARARLVDEGAAQLLLIGGAAHAVQPPAGSSPRPPLRIVTPSATFEIGQAGELYAVLFDGGASWVAVLGGGAAVSIGEADARHRLRTVELGRGQAVAVPNRIAEITEGPRGLAMAREMARALAVPPPEPELERLDRDITNETGRLDEALRWLETETRRGRELTEQHAEAVRERNAEESERLQRELVGHSQELYRLRQLATARWERLRAQCLRRGVIARPPTEDPVAARRERVVGLLGL